MSNHQIEPDDELQEISKLYPGLVPQRLAEAKENMEKYIEDALVMYEAIRGDPEHYAEFRKLLEKLRKEKTAGE